MAVIVIVIIITLIAIPVVQNIVMNSKKDGLIASTKISIKAIESVCLQNNADGKYTYDESKEGFVSSNGLYIAKIKGKIEPDSYIVVEDCKVSEVYTLYEKYSIDNTDYIVSEADDYSDERDEYFDCSYDEKCDLHEGGDNMCENIYENIYINPNPNISSADYLVAPIITESAATWAVASRSGTLFIVIFPY